MLDSYSTEDAKESDQQEPKYIKTTSKGRRRQSLGQLGLGLVWSGLCLVVSTGLSHVFIADIEKLTNICLCLPDTMPAML